MGATLIATLGDENWVLSADGSVIYVAGNDGFLRVFDARTGESLHSVDLGIDLGAISLSPDGTRLAVVEEVPENVQQYQSWTENSADVSLYLVDLSTFGAQELTFHVTAQSYTFADVTWSDGDTLQLSQNILPGWSGWAPLATLELATGALTGHSSYYSGLGTSASLLTIPDSTTVLLGQLGLSSAQYFLIGSDGTALRDNGIYNNNVYGYAGGVEAASGTTASDRIVIVTGGGAHLYDGAMAYIVNLASLYPNLGSAAGVTFSADGQRMFFLDPANQAVVVIDAYNYSLVATVQLPGAIFRTLKWSEEIVVAPDGNGVFYNTASGIAYASIDLPDLGTDAADQISGTAGDDLLDGRAGADLIFGLAGDDWLIGGAGNDLLDGGGGFDIASYETAGSAVSVDLGISAAQATGGADSDTLVSIEGLSGSIFNDALTGNAIDNLLLGYDGNDSLWGLGGDDDLYGENGNDLLYGGSGVDWLFGGSGNDRLDGGVGADRLEGGDGNDTYVLDDVGDVVIETATGGYDTMLVSNFSSTIASSVEALVIQSGAVNATGNFAANSLTGSDQANMLSGLGGNDILQGGAGHDTLMGGSGVDMLSGGEGNDTFRDTAADLNGDSITDFGAGDRIVISNASLAGFTFTLTGSTLTYSGGSLTLTGFTGTLTASAAAGGGVQLSTGAAATINDVRNDFNGDGRSDILWRNDNGALTNWLGQANGGFVDNGANAFASIGTTWSVDGIGDFNGDGRDDILWRHDAGHLTEWLGQANGGFVDNGANAFASISTAWSVAGIGDFN
ncbi:MAG: FG-GAP-like repeat-containing protein, partial [Pseudomonadota bacterium]